MTDHGHRVTARYPVVVRRQHSAEAGTDAQHRKIIARDQGDAHLSSIDRAGAFTA
jgi:hypothetical protein